MRTFGDFQENHRIATEEVERLDQLISGIENATYPYNSIKGDQTIVRYAPYLLDDSLIDNGWSPCEVVPLNQNYFKRRHEVLSKFDPNKVEIREERSIYRESGKSCFVFYKRSEVAFP